MTRILVYPSHCIIKDEPDLDFLRKLDQELSFKIQGAEYSPAFKAGRWDGMHRILNRHLQFPYGLLERVSALYRKYDKSFQLEDLRPAKSPTQSIDILPKLIALSQKPFPYQLEIVDIVKQKDIGIIRAATGAGKSLVSALITAHFGKPTIVYVIGNALLHQTQQLFSEIFNQKIGIIGDGLCEIHDINIASVWTVGKALDLDSKDILLDETGEEEEELSEEKHQAIRQMLKKTKVNIWDECHMAACATITEISKNTQPEHVYGMSASPFRDDGADLLIESMLGKTIINLSASRLIKEGYLAKPIIKFIEVPPFPTKLKKHYQTIYSNYIVNNEARNQLIINETQNLVKLGYKTLVLYSTIAHGELLYEKISKVLPCALLSGKDDVETRDEIKQLLESGKINCIIASKIYDIGVNIPSLSGLVLASGGKSSVRTLQRIGRVIRGYKNKTHAAIVDFIDSAHFLKQHTAIRKKIYATEEEFKVIWPKKKT